MDKTDKAYKRLKEFLLFSNDNFEAYKEFFWQSLDRNRIDAAVELLLQVSFKALNSNGEKFNELIEAVDEKTRNMLIDWLNQNHKEKVKNV